MHSNSTTGVHFFSIFTLFFNYFFAFFITQQLFQLGAPNPQLHVVNDTGCPTTLFTAFDDRCDRQQSVVNDTGCPATLFTAFDDRCDRQQSVVKKIFMFLCDD